MFMWGYAALHGSNGALSEDMNASKVQVNTAKLEALINVICQEDKSAYKYFIDQINRHVMIHSSVSFNKLLFAC